MKMATKILAIWGCIATIPFLYWSCGYLEREGIAKFGRQVDAEYYYPADLQTMNLPDWNLTNAIPLSPDAAVRSAMRYATEKNPGITSWDVMDISLRRGDGIWLYDIELTDQSRHYVRTDAKVLMDGTVWKPTKEARKK
jgi:hypothetical protein